MSPVRIRHETTYTYSHPVRFGAWRLLVRPTDTHSTRVVHASLEVSPSGPMRWVCDIYGNSVCNFWPLGPSTRVSIINHLVIERFPTPLWSTEAERARVDGPIGYDAAARIVLAPFITRDADDADEADAGYQQWLRRNGYASGEPALAYLERLTQSIHAGFAYTVRHAFGVQTPSQTVLKGGACRDLAWLMIDTLRRAGFAARFVTGYIFAESDRTHGGGATHAWCEVFLPELGWIQCDPTNGSIESSDLIRVAATTTPAEAAPISGAVLDGGAKGDLWVSVTVEKLKPPSHC